METSGRPKDDGINDSARYEFDSTYQADVASELPLVRAAPEIDVIQKNRTRCGLLHAKELSSQGAFAGSVGPLKCHSSLRFDPLMSERGEREDSNSDD
jgi:hypothetical protein